MRAERVARGLLVVSAVLLVTTAASLGFALWLASRDVTLESLAPQQRLALLDQADRVSPAVFRRFLWSGDPGFYHFRPNHDYENVYGDSFTSNDLGFRTAAATRKPAGVKRLLVVGDSWTFGPFIEERDAFPAQLERMLNRDGTRWQVYNLGMMGWSTANEVAAIRTLLPVLDPDAVVICPTPNDADESFDVWNGRLVTRGFTSRAIFRDSYLMERRWIDALREIERTAGELEAHDVPTLVYFVANWRGMHAHYARLAGLTAPAVALPAAFVTPRYRLPARIDPGEHATPEGNGLIAAYLHNALIEAGIVDGLAALDLEQPVAPIGDDYDPARVEDEFRRTLEEIYPSHGPDMIPVDPQHVLRRGIFTVPAPPGAERVEVRLRLLDAPGLYPLTVEVRLEAPGPVVERRVFERFVPGEQPVTLARPDSLDGYDFVDVTVTSDRAVLLRRTALPVAMLRPDIVVE